MINFMICRDIKISCEHCTYISCFSKQCILLPSLNVNKLLCVNINKNYSQNKNNLINITINLNVCYFLPICPVYAL